MDAVIAHDQNFSMDDWITLAVFVPIFAAFVIYIWWILR